MTPEKMIRYEEHKHMEKLVREVEKACEDVEYIVCTTARPWREKLRLVLSLMFDDLSELEEKLKYVRSLLNEGPEHDD